MKQDNFTQPVDPELYVYCNQIYSAAVGMKMPTESPSKKPAFKDEGNTYVFSDIPVNRGMLAVSKELSEMDLAEAQRLSIMTRVMQFGELLRNSVLEEFLKPGPTEDEIMVSEALIKACATAKILVDEDNIGFDISDVARIAKEITDEEEKGHD